MKDSKEQGIQLAYFIDEGRVSRLGKEFLIQPKLNGERIKIIEFHDEPVFLSSYGNEFQFLDHLRSAVINLWMKVGESFPLDGEGYVHGWDRERIDSCLRRTKNYNPDVKNLQFHCFDLPLPLPQEVRSQIIAIQKMESEFIKVVPTFKANQDNWLVFTEQFLNLGYEGSILRKLGCSYVEKKTVNMLKYKPTEHDDYLITDILEAISKEGEPKGMVGAFMVMGKELIPFKVGAGKLTHDKRIIYWRDREKILTNKMWLRVKHGKIVTTGGIPTPAVAVEVINEPSADSRF